MMREAVRCLDSGNTKGYPFQVSPTVFRQGPFRFFFFSREETRMHVHVLGPDGEAKFWIEPDVSLSHRAGLKDHDMEYLQRLVTERREEIRNAWYRHFPG